MTIEYNEAFKNAAIDLITAGIIENGSISIYSPPGPPDADGATTGTYLGGFAIGANMDAASGGASAMNGTKVFTCAQDGNIRYVRFYDGSSKFISTVGITGGDADFLFPSLFVVDDFDVTFSTMLFSYGLGATDFSTTFKNAAIDLITTNIIEAGDLLIYTGAAPGAEAAATGDLLVTITFGATMNAAASGASELGSTISGVAGNTGTAGYARFTDGTNIFEGSVGIADSGEDFILSTLSIDEFDTVSLNSFSYYWG